MQKLATQGALKNLASTDNVLSWTADHDALVWLRVRMGDGVNDLDGTGGNFTLAATVASQVLPEETIVVPASAVRAGGLVGPVAVLDGELLTATLTSPNGADTNVRVDVEVLDQVGLCEQALVGKQVHDQADGMRKIYEADGSTLLRTLTTTTSGDGGTVTETPS